MSEPYTRRSTLPPQRPRPPGLDERVARLERFEEEQGSKNSDLIDELHAVRRDVGEIKMNLAVLVAQKNEAEKSATKAEAEAVKTKERWLKIGFWFMTSIAVPALVWVAHVMSVTQQAKIFP